MPQIEGLNKLIQRIHGLKVKAKGASVGVQVGYSQNYALPVHEDLDAHHPVGQAKYLEAPARSMQGELARIISSMYRRTKDMSKALLIAGLRLQRESQKLVPVDTSALRASAYTALDKDASSVAAAAFAQSEGLRTAKLKKRAEKKAKMKAKKKRKRK